MSHLFTIGFLVLVIVSCQSENDLDDNLEINAGHPDRITFIESDSSLLDEVIDSIKPHWIHPESPQKTPHPITEKMKFQGFEFGDYAHFNFISEQEKSYDFGFGYNNLESFDILFEESTSSDHYIGQWFLITWDSLWSGYPCCEGEYDIHYSFMPSIVKIKAL